MKSKSLLLFSLPIILAFCNQSIANNTKHIVMVDSKSESKELHIAALEAKLSAAELAAAKAELAAAEADSELAIAELELEAAADLELAALEAKLAAAELAAAKAELAAAEADSELTIAVLDNASWIYVETSTTGMDYYLDYNSIRKEDKYESLIYEDGTLDFVNSYKRAWWKAVEANGEYTMIQTKFYCNKDITLDIDYVNYDANNNYIGKSYVIDKLDPVIPGTVFFKLSNLVCNYF